jgi:hypothetical protein
MCLLVSLLLASVASLQLQLQGIHTTRVHRARVAPPQLCTPYILTDSDIEQLLSKKEYALYAPCAQAASRRP